MRNWVKFIIIGFLFAALLSACGGNSLPGDENGGIENEENILEDLPVEVQEMIAEMEVLPDYPLISELETSPNIIGPGDMITFSGAPGLSGTVTITHGSWIESIEFSSGSGTYAVPPDAPDGVYSISLENEERATAYGSFRVASSPGIWLDVRGSFVGLDDSVQVRVTAHQVPLDLVAIFQTGDLAQDEFSEDEFDDTFEPFDPFAFDGPSVYLVPSASGELVLGSLPGVPLSEIIDQTFLLPGRFANQIQVYALDPELAQLIAEGDFEALSAFDDEFLPEGMEAFSDIIPIQQCNQEGEVSGNLGGAGTVRAVSTEGEWVTRIFTTQDGAYSIKLPAGKALIEGWREDGEEFIYFKQQVVEVPCGESLKVNFAAVSSPRLASLIPAAPLNTIAAQGGDSEEICERIFVDKPGVVPEGFEGAEILTSIFAAQLDAELERASVAKFFDSATLIELAAQDQLNGEEGDGQDYIQIIRDNLSAEIVVFYQVYRLSGDQFASVTAFDTSKGWQAPFARTIIWGETLSELSKLPDSFVEKIQKARVCAKIEPAESVIEPNESVELTIEMTDLDGEAHEKVDISLESNKPVCGSLEWTEKSIEDTSVTNKYTANDELSCSDTVVFVGETEGPQGKIKTLPDQGTARIIKPILYHFNMAMVFYGEDGGAIDFNWDADFYADEDNLVKTVSKPADPQGAIGAFTSQNVHCEVHENGVLTFRSDHLNPNATWDIELGGSMEVFENGFVEARLVPAGTSWNFDMEPFPEQCTLLIENIFIYFMKLISLQPNNLVRGGAFELGKLDPPYTTNFPLEGSSGFEVTITKVKTE